MRSLFSKLQSRLQKGNSMKILVTGATGTVGGHVVRHLTGQGHEVRVLVRDPAKVDFPAEVDVVQGDLTDASDVRRALDGVDRAFLNMADDNGAVFAEVAGEAGLGHTVLLSSFTAEHPLPSGDQNIIAARHKAGELALTEAGVPSTFLRAAGFNYNILMWAGGATDGVIRTPYPDVKLPVVHPEDIAASAAAVLLSEDPAGGIYTTTGPEKLSVRDQAQILSGLDGKDFRVETMAEEEAKSSKFPEGTPDFVTTSVLETMSPAASVLDPTGDVEVLTGHAPHTFGDWANENEEAF